MSAGLDRFVEAQAPVWSDVVAELRAGRKRTHWMWFVFPQLAGLGRSAMAARYAIADLKEARLYAAHSVLGPRLREGADLVATHADRGLTAILGTPDDLKFVSSMTLFEAAGEGWCGAVLDRANGGLRDDRTRAMLKR